MARKARVIAYCSDYNGHRCLFLMDASDERLPGGKWANGHYFIVAKPDAVHYDHGSRIVAAHGLIFTVFADRSIKEARFRPDTIDQCPECGQPTTIVSPSDESDPSYAQCSAEDCAWERQACADCGAQIIHDDEHGWRHVINVLAGRAVSPCFLARGEVG